MQKKFYGVIGALLLSIVTFAVIMAFSLISMFKLFPFLRNIIPEEYFTHFIVILPAILPDHLFFLGSLPVDIILIYLLPIVFFFVFYIVAPYVFVFWFRVHRLVKRRGKYGQIKMGEKLKATHLYYRAFIISLFCFSISALVVGAGFGGIFRANMMQDTLLVAALNEAEAVFLGTFFMVPFVLILFFPLWILVDSGVVMFRVFPDERWAPEVEGIHAFYQNIMQGYAGFSAVLSLIIYIGTIFLGYAAEGHMPIMNWTLLTPAILIFLPFIVTGLFAPPILLYEKFFPKIMERTQKKIDKFNLPDVKVPTRDESKA